MYVESQFIEHVLNSTVKGYCLCFRNLTLLPRFDHLTIFKMDDLKKVMKG
jgi:hypothetical protein